MGTIKEFVGKFISKLFLSDYLGGVMRTAFAALGGYMIAHMGNVDLVNDFINSLTNLALGMLPVAIAWVSSVVNKKV